MGNFQDRDVIKAREVDTLKNRNRTFEITILALLASLNAVIELTLGNYLHSIKFPLVGSIMVGINVIIYTVGYYQVPRRGSILTMGFITALINLFFGGSFKPWAIIAIFLESGIIEAIIGTFGVKTWSVFTASICSNFFSLAYTLTVFGFILGHGVIETFVTIFGRLTWDDQLVKSSLVLAGILVALIHLANSLVFSWLALKFNQMANLVERGRCGVSEME